MYKNMSQYNKWNLSHEIYLFAFRVHKLTKFARIGRMSVVVAELLVTSVSIAIINVRRRFMAHGGMLLNTSNCSPMNADNPDFCEKIFFFNSFICLTLHKLEFVVKMVLVYIFDLFKDNLFAFLRGHIIARNYFLNHELFIIYEKNLLFKKTFFYLTCISEGKSSSNQQ